MYSLALATAPALFNQSTATDASTGPLIVSVPRKIEAALVKLDRSADELAPVSPPNVVGDV